MGYANVDVLLSEIGVSHLREWMALDRIEHEEALQRQAAARVEAQLGR